jgi:hypothetical protein
MLRILFLAITFTTAQAWGAGWLMASPSSAEFGVVQTGAPLISRTVYLNNYGSDAVQSISIFGFCSGEFHIYDACYGDLQPNSSCPIMIDFLAGRAGELNCSIDVYSVGSGSLRIPVHATVNEE